MDQSKVGVKKMVNKPQNIGADAAQTLTVEQIRKYDTLVAEVLGGANMLVWRQVLGTNYDYDPGIHDFQFKSAVYPFFTQGLSKYGVESMRVNVRYSSFTQNMVAIAQDVEELYKDLQSYARNVSGQIDVLSDNIRAAAHQIGWEEDYKLYNGDTDQGLTGIQSGDGTTSITDLGAPTGAWDDPTDVFTDIPAGVKRLRRYGFTGPVNMITDPYLGSQTWIGKMLDDGTNYYDASVLNWTLDMLAGGRIILTPYPWVDPSTTQATARAIPEISAGANHYCVWQHASPDNHVAVAEDVKGFEKPAVEGDIARRYREFISVKINQPRALCYMDGIDETT